MFPAKLRKQLEEVVHHGMVVSRDIFTNSLVLYPAPAWNKVIEEMGHLSRYDEEHQLFLQDFMKGATQIELDETGRLLIPGALLMYAGIDLKKKQRNRSFRNAEQDENLEYRELSQICFE